jgi:hypothetical protein
MNEKIDPLIQREFDRLGFNVVENENLADLIISKANHRRNKLVGIAVAVVAAVVILTLSIYSGLNQDSNPSSAGGKSASLTSQGDSQEVQPLPLTGYLDIDGSNPKSAKGIFYFKLSMGQMMQAITDNPDPSQGIVGKIEVFSIKDGIPERLVQTYDMGSRTHINEFGAPEDATYRWVLHFNNPNFQGRVRFAFVRTN